VARFQLVQWRLGLGRLGFRQLLQRFLACFRLFQRLVLRITTISPINGFNIQRQGGPHKGSPCHVLARLSRTSAKPGASLQAGGRVTIEQLDSRLRGNDAEDLR
jgi:hypothetical protein